LKKLTIKNHEKNYIIKPFLNGTSAMKREKYKKILYSGTNNAYKDWRSDTSKGIYLPPESD